MIGRDSAHSNTLNLLNGSKDPLRKKEAPHRWLNQPLSQPLESLDQEVSPEQQGPQDHQDQREKGEGMVLKEWMESKALQEMWSSSPPTLAPTRALTTSFNQSSHKQSKT